MSAIVPLGGRGLTGFLGTLGLLVGYSLAAPRFGLPHARLFADLWRGNLGLDPRQGVTTILLVVSVILVGFAVFAHLRPLVHLRIDRSEGSVSFVRWWRPRTTVAIDKVGTITIERGSVSYDVKYQTGQVARRQLTMHRVYLRSLYEHDLYSSSSEEAAKGWAGRLARLLGTRVA